MPSLSKERIQRSVERVQANFPFRNYVRKGEAKGLEFILRLLAKHLPVEASRLLDIGCGPFDKTAVFADLGFECSAVDDLSDDWHRRGTNLERILEFGRTMNINFHLQQFGDYAIPFTKSSFDIVSLFAVIEHLHESPAGILSAAGYHLKNGGLLCVTMPNSVNLRKRLSVLRGKTNYPPVDQFFLNEGTWRGHVREYTLSETEYIVKAAGFEILEATTYEEIAFNKLHGITLRIYLLLCNIFPGLRSGICVIARKPENWIPIQFDAEAYRKAVSASLPPGIV